MLDADAEVLCDDFWIIGDWLPVGSEPPAEEGGKGGRRRSCCGTHGLREDGTSDDLGVARNYGVPARSNSVHPMGNPISHSWRLGFVREGIYVPRRSADLRELLPPALDTPLFRGVGKKGRDPKSIADMGGAKVGSLEAMPDRIVPERGQVSEHPGEPSTVGSRKQLWNVLHDREAGSKLANKARIFSPEAGALPINARSLTSLGQVLAGKTPADCVNGNAIGSKPVCGKIADVMVAGNLRPVFGKDAARELFDLAERDGLEPAGALQTEREPANAAEQIEKAIRLSHALASRVSPRLAGGGVDVGHASIPLIRLTRWSNLTISTQHSPGSPMRTFTTASWPSFAVLSFR